MKVSKIPICSLILLMMISVIPSQNFLIHSNTFDGSILSPNEQNRVSNLATQIIPYVDQHYGFTDGIIDPTEYSFQYTDPNTTVTLYMEHSGSTVYLGLSAPTSGCVGVAWQNESDNFVSQGLNQSDILIGYAPNETLASYPRVIGTDIVQVHYDCFFRNGTHFISGIVPTLEEEVPIQDTYLLEGYKEQIIGMRIGETRRVIIPAEDAYPTPGYYLYGEILDYTITLEAIKREGIEYWSNPALSNKVTFEDAHGNDSLDFEMDLDSTRILSVNASDDGETTQVEFELSMTSFDGEDISLFNNSELSYPFILLMSENETFDGTFNHTAFSNPLWLTLEPNTPPEINLINPVSTDIEGTFDFEVTISDNTFEKFVQYQINNLSLNKMYYNVTTHTWKFRFACRDFPLGNYSVSFYTMDSSGLPANLSIDIRIVDTLAPVINSPGDIEFLNGTTGNLLVWYVDDDRPAHYTVLYNGDDYLEQSWNGSDIVIDLDNLSVGIHNFTLIIQDSLSHTSYDQVLVTVLLPPTTGTTTTSSEVVSTTHSSESSTSDTTTTTQPPTSPLDIGLIITLVSAGIIIIFSALILYHLRRNSG